MKKTVLLLVLVTCRIYGKVVVNEDHLPDVTKNLVEHEAKVVPSILFVSPFHKKIISDIVFKSKNNDEHKNKTSVNPESHKSCSDTNKTDIIDNLIEPDEYDVPCEIPAKIDNGSALKLTPYIENGQLVEARNASKVNPDLFLGYESYSGFITVNKTYDSNIFFWYFPVLEKPVNETPWIIWLQGGPGASSLTGLFDEIGPFKLNSSKELIHNPFSWIHNHSLVFIDNPVGAGYSYTNHIDGYANDTRECAMNLLETVHQFLQIFPELRTAPLYVAGESYAGKYVPALSLELHKHKDLPGFDVNLEGMMVGNAYMDPSMISRVSYPFYYFGLLSKEQIEIVDPLLKSFQQDIADNNSLGAKNKWSSLIAVLLFLTHQKHAYNFLKDDLSIGHYVNFLKTSEVMRAIHVGDIQFSFVNLTTNAKMSPDFLTSSKPLFEDLLEHYRVLIYCGQLDQMLPCIFTSDHLRTWKWSGSSEFLEADRYPYIYKSKLAGYHKTGGQLTEVVVRGAGHLVPMDQPGPIQNLVARWIQRRPLSHRFGFLEGSYIQEFIRNHTVVYLNILVQASRMYLKMAFSIKYMKEIDFNRPKRADNDNYFDYDICVEKGVGLENTDVPVDEHSAEDLSGEIVDLIFCGVSDIMCKLR